MKLNQRTKNIILFLILIMLFSSTSFIAVNAVFAISDTIYEGIFIGDIPVGGLSVEEAKNKILANFKNRTEKSSFLLKGRTQTWSIKVVDIDLEIDADSLARQAYNVGRIGNAVNRLQERYLTVNHGYTIPLALHYNQTKLQEIINTIADSIYINPENAILEYRNSKITIQPERNGYKLDVEKTWAGLTALIDSNIPVAFTLTVNEIPPAIRSQDLVGVDNLLSIYTTQFDPYNQNRSQNISLAARNINAILLHPGEVFSFNKYVGERLSEFGYKEAPVFIDGKLVLDWGGGVCQVSSTLYNAVLLADMKIEERTSHFHPPSYVPLGQDAAVADNLLDFKFKNTTDNNIYITCEVSNQEIIVQIFGKSNSVNTDIRIISTDKKVLEPNTVVKQDPNLELGKEIIDSEGEKGFQVTTYRVKSFKGQEVKREYLAYDEYKAEDKIIRIGTKLLNNQVTK